MRRLVAAWLAAAGGCFLPQDAPLPRPAPDTEIACGTFLSALRAEDVERSVSQARVLTRSGNKRVATAARGVLRRIDESTAADLAVWVATLAEVCGDHLEGR